MHAQFPDEEGSTSHCWYNVKPLDYFNNQPWGTKVSCDHHVILLSCCVFVCRYLCLHSLLSVTSLLLTSPWLSATVRQLLLCPRWLKPHSNTLNHWLLAKERLPLYHPLSRLTNGTAWHFNQGGSLQTMHSQTTSVRKKQRLTSYMFMLNNVLTVLWCTSTENLPSPLLLCPSLLNSYTPFLSLMLTLNHPLSLSPFHWEAMTFAPYKPPITVHPLIQSLCIYDPRPDWLITPPVRYNW